LANGYTLMADPPGQDEPINVCYLRVKGQTDTTLLAKLRLGSLTSAIDGEYDKAEYWITDGFVSEGYHARPQDYRYSSSVASNSQKDWYGLTTGLYYWVRARAMRATGVRGGWFERQVLMITE